MDDEKKDKIFSDPDFIHSPKHDNSLAKLIKKYDEGIPDKRIVRVLMITQEELEKIYKGAVEKLRKTLGA